MRILSFAWKKAKAVSHWLFPKLLSVSLCLLMLIGYAPPVRAQVAQFPCNQDFYFSQGTAPNPVVINRIQTSTGVFNPAAFAGFSNAGNIDFNALAYNVNDGNLYALGIAPTNVGGTIYRYSVYRITPSNPVLLGTVDVDLPSANPADITNTAQAFAGDFDASNNLVVLTNVSAGGVGANIFRISIPTLPVGTVTAFKIASNPFVPDIAFNPGDGRFYGLNRDSGNSLISFQFTGAAAPALTTTAVAGVGAGPYGGAFFDGAGNFYAYRNPGTGLFVRISGIPGAPVLTELSANPGPSQRNDGASCAYVPDFKKTVTPSPALAGSTVTYTYTFTNRTTIDLNNLIFSDAMDGGRTFVPGSQTITGFSGTANVSFGAGNTNFTITGIGLARVAAPPGATVGTITVQVQLPVALAGRVFNQATLSGQIGGTTTQFDSKSDNPNTLAFPDRTPLDVGPARGIIGVAKQAGTPQVVAAGVFDVPFTVRVENSGPLRLDNVQLTENLAAAFTGATARTLQVAPAVSLTGNTGGGAFVGPPTPAPALNAGFNGGIGGGPANNNLLGAGTTLAPGDFIELTFTVRVTPGATLSYTNTVTATGTDASGNPVQDVSQNGLNVDPDGDGNPGNNDVPTPVNFGPALGLIKRIFNVTGVTAFPPGFFNQVVNSADPNVAALQAANVPPTGVTTISPANGNPTLQSGDTVTYRVYFINTGGATATNVGLCDQIPPGTTFVGGSINRGLQAAVGAAPTVTALPDGTNFTAAGTPVGTPPCLGPAANPTGAVVPATFNVNSGIGGYLEFRTLIP